jgi:subtilisin family serine protease
MSLGGGASSSLDSAVASLVSSGVAVVVAAGNSNTDACTTSPARAAPAITVAATTTSDSRASYSNFGSCVDLFAPGSNIVSTVPGGGTATYSGTSMAAPHVAGAAAVALSLRDYTPSALALHLAEVATTGVVGSAGAGSPNLLAYVSPAATTPTPSEPEPVATVPDQPGAPSVESRNKAVVVSWDIPADGGSVITSQIVRAYSSGRLTATVTVDGATTSTRVTRLRNGTEYTFTVQARNAIGVGPESAQSVPVRPSR